MQTGCVLLPTPAFKGLRHKITSRGFEQSKCICTKRKPLLRRKEQLLNKTLGILSVFHRQACHSLASRHHCLGVEQIRPRTRAMAIPFVQLINPALFSSSCSPFLSSSKTLPLLGCCSPSLAGWGGPALPGHLQWYMYCKWLWLGAAPSCARQPEEGGHHALQAARNRELQVAHIFYLQTSILPSELHSLMATSCSCLLWRTAQAGRAIHLWQEFGPHTRTEGPSAV